MIARDLERLLVAEGANATKVSTIMRQLRENGRLPNSGRGLQAPAISALEAASMLAAIAGSTRANVAGKRIAVLEQLELVSSAGRLTFVARLAALLDDEAQTGGVFEIRVARTIGRAVIIYRDGTVEEFLGSERHDFNRRFRAVGELPGGLLELVARLLKAPVKRRTRKRRKAEDWRD